MCDISTVSPRPLVHESYQRTVFDALHSLSHLGIAAAVKLVSARFFWPNMYRVVTAWTCLCIPCQHFKVTRHVRDPVGQFTQVEDSFSAILHIDLGGP